jgi:hypothetical protein
VDDVQAAKLYSQGIISLDLLPSIQRAVSAVANILMPQITQLLAQSNEQITARLSNAFADRDAEAITAIQLLPVLTLDGAASVPAPVPDVFPPTRGALFALPQKHLATLLTYYGLDVEGTLEQKRARLAAYLGLPPRR